MKPGTIIYTGKTKKGTDIIIRYPLKTDVEEMQRYINTLSKERTFILFQGEQMNLKEETKFVQSVLKKMRDHKAVMLLVFHKEYLIGVSQISMREKAEKHVGDFGISVAKEYRGEGIGKLLMRLVFEEAEKHLTDLRTCAWGVFSDNTVAQSLYKKFGGIEYGRLPKGIRHNQAFVDHIYLYKEIKS